MPRTPHSYCTCLSTSKENGADTDPDIDADVCVTRHTTLCTADQIALIPTLFFGGGQKRHDNK